MTVGQELLEGCEGAGVEGGDLRPRTTGAQPAREERDAQTRRSRWSAGVAVSRRRVRVRQHGAVDGGGGRRARCETHPWTGSDYAETLRLFDRQPPAFGFQLAVRGARPVLPWLMVGGRLGWATASAVVDEESAAAQRRGSGGVHRPLPLRCTLPEERHRKGARGARAWRIRTVRAVAPCDPFGLASPDAAHRCAVSSRPRARTGRTSRPHRPSRWYARNPCPPPLSPPPRR